MSGLYTDGAKVGETIGHMLAGVRRVIENVRDYVNGIEDAARVASKTKGDGDDGDRRDG